MAKIDTSTMAKPFDVPTDEGTDTFAALYLAGTNGRVLAAVAAYRSTAKGKDLADAAGISTGKVSYMRTAGEWVIKCGKVSGTLAVGRDALDYAAKTPAKDRPADLADLTGSALAARIRELAEARRESVKTRGAQVPDGAEDGATGETGEGSTGETGETGETVNPGDLAGQVRAFALLLSRVRDEDTRNPSDALLDAFGLVSAELARLADAMGETVEELAKRSA